MAISLVDTLLSYQLSQSGATPTPASTPVGSPSTSPTPDLYAPDPNKLTSLSGYGQLLSAASRASDALSTPSSGTFSGTKTAATSSSAVATATYDATAAAGPYAVAVSQVATAQSYSTGYFSSASSAVVAPGTFNIQTGASSGGIFSSDGSNPKTVTVADGSLNGLRDAINHSGANVTASVVNDSYGYRLQITGKTVGAGNGFAIQDANPGDPLASYQTALGTLSFSQSTAANDASYTVNGGSTQTSSSNTVQLATGINATLTGAGSTTISAVDGNTLAQSLTSAYNALQGNIKQLTSSTGSLSSDQTTANNLSTALNTAAQASIDGNPAHTLGSLGISLTTPGSSTSPLTVNASALQAALNSDSQGTVNLLSTAINQINSVIQGFTNSGNGNASTGLLAKQYAIYGSIQSDISTTLTGQGASVSTSLLNTLTQREVAAGSAILGLPGFSAYA